MRKYWLSFNFLGTRWLSQRTREADLTKPNASSALSNQWSTKRSCHAATFSASSVWRVAWNLPRLSLSTAQFAGPPLTKWNTVEKGSTSSTGSGTVAKNVGLPAVVSAPERSKHRHLTSCHCQGCRKSKFYSSYTFLFLVTILHSLDMNYAP